MKRVCVLLIFLIVLLPLLAAGQVPLERQVENVTAFGRIFGLIRYFYAGDEAREITWNKLAMHGVKHVQNAADDIELAQAIHDVLLPVAPALQLYSPSSSFPALRGGVRPPLEGEFGSTFWQYRGLPSMQQSVYQRCRSNRAFKIPKSPSSPGVFGMICPVLPEIDAFASALRVSFSCFATAADSIIPAYDLAYDRATAEETLHKGSWQRVAHEFDALQKLTDLRLFFSEFDRVLIDSILVEQRIGEAWKEMYRNEFSDAKPGKLPRRMDVNCSRSITYISVNVDALCELDGENMVLAMTPVSATADATLGIMYRLFDAEPDWDDMVDEALTDNIRCRFPLVLPCDDAHTYPQADSTALAALLQELDGIDVKRRDDPLAWPAGVIAYWNDLRLFFPYWQFTDVDWDAELTRGVRQVLIASDFSEYRLTVQSMASKTLDGHAILIDPLAPGKTPGFMPAMVEGKWIVKRVSDHNLSVLPGAEVLTLNGQDFAALLREQKRYYTLATDGDTYTRMFFYYARTLADTVLAFEFRSPDGIIEEHKVRMGTFPDVLNATQDAGVIRYDNGVIYLNACTLSDPEWQAMLPELTEAKAIIFDFRDYPSVGLELIRHLIMEPNTARFSCDLLYIHPGTPLPAKRYSPYPEWALEPQEPYLNALKVFLTGPGGVSYCETYLQVLRHNKVGAYIGQNTAGTTGNVNITQVPGNMYIYWTGMFVENPDGSRFHGIGVVPDIPVSPSIQMLSEGRDADLEAALEYITHELGWENIPSETDRIPVREGVE